METRTYRYPRLVGWYSAGGLILSISFLGLLLWLVLTSDRIADRLGFLAIGLLFLSPIKSCYEGWRRRRDEFHLKEEGLVHASAVRTRTIPWTMIAQVRGRDLQRELALSGPSSGQPLVKIGYGLEDFVEFALLISAAATDPRDGKLPRTFRASRLRPWLVMGISLGVFAVTLFFDSETDPWVTAAFAGSGMLAILWHFAFRSTCEVRTDRLIIRRPVSSREAPFSRIKDVDWDVPPFAKKSQPAVVVERVNRRPIRIEFVREGTLALFLALRGAWATHGDQATSPHVIV